MSTRVLVLQHEESCPVGWLGEWLSAAGAELVAVRCWDGEQLPAGGFDGLVVLGSSLGAYDDDRGPWLPAVRDAVRAAAADGVPVLGICLGHQLVAVALGGEVAQRPAGQHIGVVDLHWTPDAAGDPIAAAVPAGPCVHWNNDVVSRLPRGSVLLATSGPGDVAVARFAPLVWGIQPHPEAGATILALWADEDRDEAASRGVDLDHHVAQAAARATELHDAWQPLGPAFVRVCEEAALERSARAPRVAAG